MKTVYIFLGEGFEEIEAVTPLDLLRRVGVDAKFVSIGSSLQVKGAHDILFTADLLFEDAIVKKPHGIVLPGGMPGTTNLLAHKGLCSLIKEFALEKKPVCAICAAPLILGELGLLTGKTATIYPAWKISSSAQFLPKAQSVLTAISLPPADPAQQFRSH